MEGLEKYTRAQLLTAMFDWAYQNDKRLYFNFDSTESAHSLRRGVDDTHRELLSREDFDVMDVLKQAIKISDYHDTYRFQWVFNGGGGKSNVLPNSVYSSFEDHEYSSLRLNIKERLDELTSLGLAEWRKSADHVKWSNLRDCLELIKTQWGERITLCVCQEGDSFSTTLHIDGKVQVLDYILEKNIVPDGTITSVTWRDELNPDFDNPRVVKNLLGRYLVYLTAEELLEIKKKIIVQSYDRPEWAYITAAAKHRDGIKFYVKLKMNV